MIATARLQVDTCFGLLPIILMQVLFESLIKACVLFMCCSCNVTNLTLQVIESNAHD